MKKLLLSIFVIALTIQANAQFQTSDVQFWVGEGTDTSIVIIDFQTAEPSSIAWGVLYDDSLTSGEMLDLIIAADPSLEVNKSSFLNDIIYRNWKGIGGSPNYWGTFYKSVGGSWDGNNGGLTHKLGNGDWFGFSYTDFAPALDPRNPVAATKFSWSDIEFWVGSGQDSAMFVVDFQVMGQPSSFAWGVAFEDSITSGEAFDMLIANDRKLDANVGAFLNDVLYDDFEGLAGTPNWWGTFVRESAGSWDGNNSGLSHKLGDGMSFGLSYTDFAPALAPGEPLPALPFGKDDVVFWLGDGDSEAYLVVEFNDGANSTFAWGIRFDGDSITGRELVEAVDLGDSNIAVNMGAFLNDIEYLQFEGNGGAPNWWGSFTGMNSALWEGNNGVDDKLANGQWFGLSYTDFNPTLSPRQPLPATPSGAAPIEFEIDDIDYWFGEGDDSLIVILDFGQSSDHSLAWGVFFSDSLTIEKAFMEIADIDPSFSVIEGSGLVGVSYDGMGELQSGDTSWAFYGRGPGEAWDTATYDQTYFYPNDWVAGAFVVLGTDTIPREAVAAKFQPFASGPDDEGTDAIHKDSSIIVNWATGVTITRGKRDIAVDTSSLASYGSDDEALGQAEGDGLSVVSLGDSGVAVLTFDYPISDGTGPDFAIFENGIGDRFLELAFVEVSSNGVDYFRFPATSFTPAVVQIGAFDETIEPYWINNLAGKYRQGFGTPFDLDDLSDAAGLNLDNITHVKIIDVVGSLDADVAGQDLDGRLINDAYPTPYASGGFDLDAVAVINQNVVGLDDEELAISLTAYPNPTIDLVHLVWEGTGRLDIMSATGNQIESAMFSGGTSVDLSAYSPGVYKVRVTTQKGMGMKTIVKN